MTFSNQQVVYDSVEPSPFYDDNGKEDPYIDEKDFIELAQPGEQTEGQINEPYQKRYYFNPTNLPYTLEQPHSYSAKNQSDAKGTDKRGPRLNRYYEKLKPYYKLQKGSYHTDKTLVFESRFESGNLRKAVKVGEFEYDLYLKADYGTQTF